MKRIIIASIVIAMVLSLGLAFAGKNEKGNGAPNGPHENINIIGVPNPLGPNFSGGNGSRIFVLRTGQTVFYVYGGDKYEIKDRDGTDGKVGEPGRGYENAGLVLPYLAGSGPEGDGGAYQCKIYVRLLGPMDSSIKIKSEYFDGSGWLLIDEFILDRVTTKKFQMKSNSLLKDGYRDITWTLDEKTNFKILQMRIYMVPRTQ